MPSAALSAPWTPSPSGPRWTMVWHIARTAAGSARPSPRTSTIPAMPHITRSPPLPTLGGILRGPMGGKSTPAPGSIMPRGWEIVSSELLTAPGDAFVGRLDGLCVRDEVTPAYRCANDDARAHED